MSAIRATGLRCTFDELVAVEGLDLAINPGEVFGLVGPDGAGKTTTMRMLTGLIRPTAGTATVAGCDVVRDAERLKEQIGYMSQRFGLYPDLTVLENIEFYADIYGVPARGRAEKLERLLGFSHLTPSSTPRRQPPGGMKQKLVWPARSSTRRACCSSTSRPMGSTGVAPRFLAHSLPVGARRGDNFHLHRLSRRSRALQPAGVACTRAACWPSAHRTRSKP